MPSFFRNGESPGEDRLVREFDRLWAAGHPPSPEAFWAQHGAGSDLATLVGLIKVDIRRRYDRGEPVAASEYLDRFPELRDENSRVVSLVYEEFCLREERGEQVDVDRFCSAYEPWRSSLLSQLGYHNQLSMASQRTRPRTDFPLPGERFSEYTLHRLLGKGGSGQVYLAHDESLERKVVLKLSGAEGREATILAHLHHPNIVSVLRKIEPTESGLRGFSMLYSPGMTLDRLIRAMRTGARPRTARDLCGLLASPEGEPPPTPGRSTGWRDFPAGGSYQDAVAWVGLCLANALAHAHEGGILHRDVKPANILLAFGEGPMLFDFNLADDPRTPEEARAAHTGGTLPYMAPEQLHAFVDPRAWDLVGGQADLFALGLVLRELLTHRPPEVPAADLPLARAISELLDQRCRPPVPVREEHPEVPPSLDSILCHCLEPSLTRRYASARDLAEDLRRYLDRLPLRHAPNTSVRERAANLARRNRPSPAATLATLVLVAAVGLFAWWMTRPVPVQDSPEFRAAALLFDAGKWREARDAFRKIADANPQSAYPKLYLALAIERLEGEGANTYELYDSLAQCADAGEAVEERLQVEPDSPFLLTERGWIAYANEDMAAACAILAPICKRADAPYHALAILAEAECPLVDPTEDQARAAVVHFGEALNRARAKRNPSAEAFVKYGNERQLTKVMVYARLIDKNAVSAPLLRLLGETLDQTERQVGQVEAAASAKPPAQTKPSSRYLTQYARGFIMAGRSRLMLCDGNSREAERLAREALKQFERANRELAPSGPGPRPGAVPNGTLPASPYDKLPFLRMLRGYEFEPWLDRGAGDAIGLRGRKVIG